MLIIMESECNGKESLESGSSTIKKGYFFIKSNWEIDNNKSFNDCVSTVSLLQCPDRTNLEDVVSLDTCVALKSDPSGESCRLEFKVLDNYRIARIAVVSEASVLEFFKQSGEYATTAFAEFVDEFEDHAVYFAESRIQPPSREASIKFTRTKHKGTTMWIYGIKLILAEMSSSESSKSMFDMDVINNYLSDASHLRPDKFEMAKKVLQSYSDNEHSVIGDDINTIIPKLLPMEWNSCKFLVNDKKSTVEQLNGAQTDSECNGDLRPQDPFNMKTYIDNKFVTLEKRLMDRIELMDKQTNQKLDAILKRLELSIDKQ